MIEPINTGGVQPAEIFSIMLMEGKVGDTVPLNYGSGRSETGTVVAAHSCNAASIPASVLEMEYRTAYRSYTGFTLLTGTRNESQVPFLIVRRNGDVETIAVEPQSDHREAGEAGDDGGRRARTVRRWRLRSRT